VETVDPSAPALTDIRQADRLYQPFPDFASWKGLTEEDRDLWDRFAKGLEAQRAAVPPEVFGRAVEVAMRAAAIDTGAIEGLYDVDRGFTMSVATQAVAWEHAMGEKGEEVRALFEAQLEAYELVLDVATKRRPVYEAWIRQLHEILCAAQDTYKVLTPSGWQEHDLVKGQYKTLPNHVRLKDGTFHAYAPVDQVPQEMHRLVEILTSPEFDAAHPVLQASYAHYALVNVHPFADGNGRVARALASLYFYRAVSVPLVIFANQRLAYFDVLHAADAGHLDPLLAFFRDRGIDTMQLVTESLHMPGSPLPEEIAVELAALRAGKRELDEPIASRLVDAIETELLRQVDRLHPQGIFLRTDKNLVFTADGPRGILSTDLYSQLSGEAISRDFRASVDTDARLAFRVQLVTDLEALRLDVRLEDVSPELTESFRFRLTNWIKLNLSQMLLELRKQVKDSLESSSERKNP